MMGSQYLQREESLSRNPRVCIPSRIPYKLKNVMDLVDPSLWYLCYFFFFFVLVSTYSRDQASLEGLPAGEGDPWNLGVAHFLVSAPGHRPRHTTQAAASEAGTINRQELPGAGHKGLATQAPL